MKPTRYKIWAALALALANGFFAAAQPNRVPGPADYAQFSSFITERNIFNPSRFARYAPSIRPQPSRPQFTPTFTLVGTMSYDKGIFAFFDGNQPDLRKVLYPSDTNGIAVFTIADITLGTVTLQSADKKQTVELKIGQGMQQEGNSWQLASAGGYSGGGNSDYGGRNRSYGGRNRSYGGGGGADNVAPMTESSSTDTSAQPASSPALEGNDVLKKLMERRAQEDKGN